MDGGRVVRGKEISPDPAWATAMGVEDGWITGAVGVRVGSPRLGPSGSDHACWKREYAMRPAVIAMATNPMKIKRERLAIGSIDPPRIP